MGPELPSFAEDAHEPAAVGPDTRVYPYPAEGWSIERDESGAKVEHRYLLASQWRSRLHRDESGGSSNSRRPVLGVSQQPSYGRASVIKEGKQARSLDTTRPVTAIFDTDQGAAVHVLAYNLKATCAVAGSMPTRKGALVVDQPAAVERLWRPVSQIRTLLLALHGGRDTRLDSCSGLTCYFQFGFERGVIGHLVGDAGCGFVQSFGTAA